jgi:hypothetical protein
VNGTSTYPGSELLFGGFAEAEAGGGATGATLVAMELGSGPLLQESVKIAHNNPIVTLLGTRSTSSGAVRVPHSRHAYHCTQMRVPFHADVSSARSLALRLYARSSCSRKKIVGVVFRSSCSPQRARHDRDCDHQRGFIQPKSDAETS